MADCLARLARDRDDDGLVVFEYLPANVEPSLDLLMLVISLRMTIVWSKN